MKKTIIALSAILLASPVIAATTHATDNDVAAAHENANTAKEKLHQAQNQGEEQKLKTLDPPIINDSDTTTLALPCFRLTESHFAQTASLLNNISYRWVIH